MIEQGEIYFADVGDGGRRPVLIVSRAALNRGRYVTGIAFTSARVAERRRMSNCVFFRAGEFGLTADCVAQCETITAVHVDQLDAFPIGLLDPTALRNVIKAIGEVIDSECEPT